MKKQILTLIIGILIGAIITTAVFLIIKGNNTEGQGGKMNRGEMPSMEGGFSQQEEKASNQTRNTTTNNSIEE